LGNGNESDARHLFEKTAHDRTGPLWVLLLTTGLRLGEALGLKWSDIDLENHTLTVQRALQRRRGGGIGFVEPKTHRSRRVDHLAELTVAVLRVHHRRQVETRLAAGAAWQDHGVVFTTPIGTPLTPEATSHAWRTTCTRVGLPPVRLHDLRHTAATLMLAWDNIRRSCRRCWDIRRLALPSISTATSPPLFTAPPRRSSTGSWGDWRHLKLIGVSFGVNPSVH